MRTLLILLLALLPAACGSDPLAVPENLPFLRGTITARDARGFLVEGTPGTGFQVDRAYVKTGPETRILWKSGERARSAELKVGRVVSVWITDVILDSDPVQVFATDILIHR